VKRALILVDLQPDFCPGGALAVAEGDATLAIANALMPRFDVVVATQDWHPANHRSFATQHPGHKPGDVVDLDGLPQVLWPPHCVQDTPGAQIHPQLDHARITHVSRKGTDPTIDSYSGFFDNGHRKATGLAEWLKERGLSDLTVMGLATDFCVKFTALDALQLGFSVRLVADGCRGVNLSHGDSDQAIETMRAAGAQIIDSSRA